jgi:hypothetical protein
MNERRAVNEQAVVAIVDAQIFDERSGRHDAGAERVGEGGVRGRHDVAAGLPVRQAHPVKRGAALRGHVRRQIKHRGVVAKQARVGMRAIAALARADELHAVVVEGRALGRRLLLEVPRAGLPLDPRLDGPELFGEQRGQRAPARPGLFAVGRPERPVGAAQEALAHPERVGQRAVEHPVVAPLLQLAVGQRREAGGRGGRARGEHGGRARRALRGTPNTIGRRLRRAPYR